MFQKKKQTKNKITDILYKEFEYFGKCVGCRYWDEIQNEDKCDNCNHYADQWAISRKKAEELAERIIKC